MTKPLTEQELRERINRLNHAAFDSLLKVVNADKDLAARLYELIQSQKHAHADMVIGEDESVSFATASVSMWDGGRNQLRAEQRERNK